VFVSTDGLTAWVADYNNHRISVWTRPNTTTSATAWTNQTTFGTEGTGPNEFEFPVGVFASVDGLTLWVAEYNNSRISVWTRPNTTTDATNWTNQTTFGTDGDGPSNLANPNNVFVSADGLTAWVADYGNNRISVWTRPNTTTSATSWTNQTTFGSTGSGPSEFDYPAGVVASTDGLTVWVADLDNNRISVWTRPNTTTGATNWTNQTTFGTEGSGPGEFDDPSAVFVSADGLTAWVTELLNNRVSVWKRPNTTTDATAWTNQTTFGGDGSSPSQFYDPSGIFVSANGLTAWVADLDNNRISVWTLS
jgi:sugar lactone lactonase YvrE